LQDKKHLSQIKSNVINTFGIRLVIAAMPWYFCHGLLRF